MRKTPTVRAAGQRRWIGVCVLVYGLLVIGAGMGFLTGGLEAAISDADPRAPADPPPDVQAVAADTGAGGRPVASDLAPAPAMAGDISVPEIKDPFFRLLVEILQSDTLGIWAQDDIRAYVERAGGECKLPIERVHHIERRRATGEEAESRRGAKVVNIWRVVLTEPLNLPMPYSVLGYHPGSLVVSREFRFSEWYLGGPNIHVASEGEVTVHSAHGLKALRLDTGWIILDVDGWLDKLLGGKLDDAWTQGFAVGRIDGELYGISIGVNHKLRPLFGDFDFREDKIYSEARPISRSLHFYVRPWITPPEGNTSTVWQYEK